MSKVYRDEKEIFDSLMIKSESDILDITDKYIKPLLDAGATEPSHKDHSKLMAYTNSIILWEIDNI